MFVSRCLHHNIWVSLARLSRHVLLRRRDGARTWSPSVGHSSQHPSEPDSDKVIWYTAIDICRRWTVHIVSLHVTISVTSAFGRHVIRIVYHDWTITITSILLLEIHMMVQLSILCVPFFTPEIYIMCALSCWFIFGAKMLLGIWCDWLHCPFSVVWAYAMYWTQPCYL